MGSVHSGFYGALFNGDEEQGRLFDDLVGSIHSADEGKAKAIYLTGSRAPPSQLMLPCLHHGLLMALSGAQTGLLVRRLVLYHFWLLITSSTCHRNTAARLS